jgi:hypothetical protein
MYASSHYHAEADHARLLAEMTIQPNVAQELRRVAQEFDRLAEDLAYANQSPTIATFLIRAERWRDSHSADRRTPGRSEHSSIGSVGFAARGTKAARPIDQSFN